MPSSNPPSPPQRSVSLPPNLLHKRSVSTPSSLFSSLFRSDSRVGSRADPRTRSNHDNVPSNHRGADSLFPTTQRRLRKRYSTFSLEKMNEGSESSNVNPSTPEKDTAARNGKRPAEYSHLPCPAPPSRQPSFTKRHASFDSPREVPLPSPSSQVSQLTGYPFPNPDHYSRHSKGYSADPSEGSHLSASRDVFGGSDDTGDSDQCMSSPASSQTSTTTPNRSSTEVVKGDSSAVDMDSTPDHSAKQHSDDDTAPSSSAPTQHQRMAHSQDAPSQPTPVFPFSRPYSLPDSASKSYGAATSQPVSPANPNWIDRSSTASLPLPSQTPYNLLPRMTDTTSAGSSQWVSDSRRGLGEPSERRPLPMRPTTQTADCPSKPSYPSSNLQSSLPSPAPVPSSPPPPYSRFLPPEQPMPTTRSLTRSVSSTSGYPAPEAPVILTPPPQAESEQGERRRAPHDSFLCHAPPPDTWIAIESSLSEYTLTVRLPGFRRDGITLATRRRRILHVVANSWEPGGGHFERRVSFGYDADLAQVRAEFDGEMLRIIVPRRPSHVSTFSGL